MVDKIGEMSSSRALEEGDGMNGVSLQLSWLSFAYDDLPGWLINGRIERGEEFWCASCGLLGFMAIITVHGVPARKKVSAHE